MYHLFFKEWAISMGYSTTDVDPFDSSIDDAFRVLTSCATI